VTHSIKGFDQMSLVDWDGMVAATIYTSGCNFRCPYCHNPGLVLFPDEYESIPIEDILSYVQEQRDFLDGVVLTGGEPCFHKEVVDLLKVLKATGMKTKLDTNGSYPDLLSSVIESGLVDYVAMDVKAPLDFDSYSKSGGFADRRLLERVRESVALLLEGHVDYEFRMTVVPALHRATDLLQVGDQLRGARRFVIQNFVPKKTIDKAFLKESPYDAERLEEFRQMVAPMFDECIIRNS
jgi:pyruvate formate lyase activating enzyme